MCLPVGLDMIAVPGTTTPATISGIIADEAAIGVINNKTTAVRIILSSEKTWATASKWAVCWVRRR